MTRIPLFFSKAGKEKADVSVRLLKEMMETSRAKQGKHYLKNNVNKENKKRKQKEQKKFISLDIKLQSS